MTEEVKSKYAHVQLFLTIQRFNSGVCIYIYTFQTLPNTSKLEN